MEWKVGLFFSCLFGILQLTCFLDSLPVSLVNSLPLVSNISIIQRPVPSYFATVFSNFLFPKSLGIKKSSATILWNLIYKINQVAFCFLQELALVELYHVSSLPIYISHLLHRLSLLNGYSHPASSNVFNFSSHKLDRSYNYDLHRHTWMGH